MKKTYIVPCTKTVHTELVEMLASSWNQIKTLNEDASEFDGEINADITVDDMNSRHEFRIFE